MSTKWNKIAWNKGHGIVAFNVLLNTLHVIAETIFAASHFIGAKPWFKLTQTTPNLHHKNVKQKLLKKLCVHKPKLDLWKLKPGLSAIYAIKPGDRSELFNTSRASMGKQSTSISSVINIVSHNRNDTLQVVWLHKCKKTEKQNAKCMTVATMKQSQDTFMYYQPR